MTIALCACGDLKVDTDSWGKPSPASVSSGQASVAGTPASFSCTPLDGRYTFSYNEIDGGCGPWSNDILVFDHGQLTQSSTSGCADGQVSMANDCELRIESSCWAVVNRGLPDLVTQQVSGSLREVSDYRYATGTVQAIFIYASGARCVGHYQVWANRN